MCVWPAVDSFLHWAGASDFKSLMYLPKIRGKLYLPVPPLGAIHSICVKPSPFGIVYGCPS